MFCQPPIRKIAFVSSRDGNTEIYVMDADGTNQQRLTNDPGAENSWPAWSPDGRQIAFIHCFPRNACDREMHVMNADGSGRRIIASDVLASGITRWPSVWAPDSYRIAFTSRESGNVDIYITTADRSWQVNLTNTRYNDIAPSWSPDGSLLVFECPGDGKLYVIDADGSGKTSVSRNAYNDGRPAWSPNGKHIAFLVRREAVWIMNPDGSERTHLSGGGGGDLVQNLLWSPDSRRIAYTRGLSHSNLYVVDIETGGVRCLTCSYPTETGSDSWPSWSSDGTHIVFDSTRDGDPQIYVVDVDTQEETCLTSEGGGNPAWQP